MDGYEATRPNRNVLRPVLGSNAPAVSLREAGLRTGHLSVLLDEYSDSQTLMDLLSSGEELTLTDTVWTGIGMSFVLAGDITHRLDAPTQLWWVEFDFQETD
ncbi:MAG: hypothetical protein ACTHMQ_05285 [Protaetiibacter sp.]